MKFILITEVAKAEVSVEEDLVTATEILRQEKVN